jgi:hypothetical protein
MKLEFLVTDPAIAGTECYRGVPELQSFADWEKVLEKVLRTMFLTYEDYPFDLRELSILDWRPEKVEAFREVFAVNFSAWIFGANLSGRSLGSFHLEGSRLIEVTFYQDDSWRLDVDACKKFSHLFPSARES